MWRAVLWRFHNLFDGEYFSSTTIVVDYAVVGLSGVAILQLSVRIASDDFSYLCDGKWKSVSLFKTNATDAQVEFEAWHHSHTTHNFVVTFLMERENPLVYLN